MITIHQEDMLNLLEDWCWDSLALHLVLLLVLLERMDFMPFLKTNHHHSDLSSISFTVKHWDFMVLSLPLLLRLLSKFPLPSRVTHKNGNNVLIFRQSVIVNKGCLNYKIASKPTQPSFSLNNSKFYFLAL